MTDQATPKQLVEEPSPANGSNGAGSSGGAAGKRSRISPGRTGGRTGLWAMPAR